MLAREAFVEGMLKRARPQRTPDWWDRDCRCCLGTRHLFHRPYHIKGGQMAITIFSEEIHADHTVADILAWQDSLPDHVRWL